jgi:hypothetical protein
MNVFVLRIRSGGNKKDYSFANVSDAVIFESTFRSKEDSKDVVTEIFFRDIEETKNLLQEISKNPIRYAEKEYLKWFHPEEVKC